MKILITLGNRAEIIQLDFIIDKRDRSYQKQ
jgi:hypothetical protein